jgi:predicted nucleic acid-binding protein
MVRVIDASVAIKWFVREDGRQEALELLRDVLAAPGSFAVPELFYFELAHVFFRTIPEPSDIQMRLLASLTTLGIRRFSMTPELLTEIDSLRRSGLSGYDAAYVGLARLLKGRWVTFDRRAHAAVAHLGLSEVPDLHSHP